MFLARGLAATAGVVALGTAGTGAYFANSAPVVRRVPVTLSGLDPALDGLRIVSFSDGHLSATYGGRRFERLVELVNEQRPDVVAIVGDLVDGDVSELREEVAPLADLVSEQGVFFVTGNHEYFVDTRGLAAPPADPRRGRAAQRAGADPAGERVRRPGGHRRPDGRAVGHARVTAPTWTRPSTAGTTPSPSSCWPTSRTWWARRRRPGWGCSCPATPTAASSGPSTTRSGWTSPSVEGLSRHGDTQLYVTAGAGYWGPPMRVGARPEVTVVELRSPQA